MHRTNECTREILCIHTFLYVFKRGSPNKPEINENLIFLKRLYDLHHVEITFNIFNRKLGRKNGDVEPALFHESCGYYLPRSKTLFRTEDRLGKILILFLETALGAA